MTTIEKIDVTPLSWRPAQREVENPCVLTYEGDCRLFYDTVATQGISYLRYVEQRCRDGLDNLAELNAPHNLTVCALVAIANRVRLDDLEVFDQLFGLVGDMFAVEKRTTCHGILTAQICADAVDFIQFHTVPNKYRSFEYPSQLNEIFDFS